VRGKDKDNRCRLERLSGTGCSLATAIGGPWSSSPTSWADGKDNEDFKGFEVFEAFDTFETGGAEQAVADERPRRRDLLLFEAILDNGKYSPGRSASCFESGQRMPLCHWRLQVQSNLVLDLHGRGCLHGQADDDGKPILHRAEQCFQAQAGVTKRPSDSIVGFQVGYWIGRKRPSDAIAGFQVGYWMGRKRPSASIVGFRGGYWIGRSSFARWRQEAMSRGGEELDVNEGPCGAGLCLVDHQLGEKKKRRSGLGETGNSPLASPRSSGRKSTGGRDDGPASGLVWWRSGP
jgi:hypothetical protein